MRFADLNKIEMNSLLKSRFCSQKHMTINWFNFKIKDALLKSQTFDIGINIQYGFFSLNQFAVYLISLFRK